MRSIKLRQLAAQAIIMGSTLPLAITRDEGGYLVHEILGSDFNPKDWRFHDSDDDSLNWGAVDIEDSEGVKAVSLVRIEC
jgi:hypothetical protein